MFNRITLLMHITTLRADIVRMENIIDNVKLPAEVRKRAEELHNQCSAIVRRLERMANTPQ